VNSGTPYAKNGTPCVKNGTPYAKNGTHKINKTNIINKYNNNNNTSSSSSGADSGRALPLHSLQDNFNRLFSKYSVPSDEKRSYFAYRDYIGNLTDLADTEINIFHPTQMRNFFGKTVYEYANKCLSGLKNFNKIPFNELVDFENRRFKLQKQRE
jgi:hypothetical protein